MKNHTGWLSGRQSRMLGGSTTSWSRSQESKFWVTPPPKGRRVDPILREGVDKRELLRQESREPLCDRLYSRDRGLTSRPGRVSVGRLPRILLLDDGSGGAGTLLHNEEPSFVLDDLLDLRLDVVPGHRESARVGTHLLVLG